MINRHNTKDQSGMASIMFAMLIVIVVSLLAIGFAVLVRNDQRQTLDKTLSNQAQYAAESAINLKKASLTAAIQAGHLGSPDSPNGSSNANCGTDTSIVGTLLPTSDMQDVKVTCLLWNTAPSTLRYGTVGISPVVVPLTPFDSTQTISTIKLTWVPTDTVVGGNTSSTNPLTLVDYPTLRITAAANSNLNSAYVVFINPSTAGGAVKLGLISSTNGGGIGNGLCATIGGVYSCSVTLTVPNATFGGGTILAISSLGRKSNVTVQAFTVVAPVTPLAIKDAQIEIDATAKSQDVIRRLKANVSIDSTTWHPAFAAFADTLCKNYRLDGASNASAPGKVNASDVTHAACP